jgi:hypothetical protein
MPILRERPSRANENGGLASHQSGPASTGFLKEALQSLWRSRMSGERILLICTGCYSLLKWLELDEIGQMILRKEGTIAAHCSHCGRLMAWQRFSTANDLAQQTTN